MPKLKVSEALWKLEEARDRLSTIEEGYYHSTGSPLDPIIAKELVQTIFAIDYAYHVLKGIDDALGLSEIYMRGVQDGLNAKETP